MTFREWLKTWRYARVDQCRFGSQFAVPDDIADTRRAAWNLTDYRVAAVQGGTIWFNHRALGSVIAWTGGTPPRPIADIHNQERTLVSALFRNQILDFRAYWGELPDRDTTRIYWNRARHDAHATYRS